jgi:hypothetical protein
VPVRDPVGNRSSVGVRGASSEITSVPAAPLFHQPWWLDALAPGRWDAVSVERGGRTAARLPFAVKGPRRFRVLTQPPLTQFLGPWVPRNPEAKQSTALGDEMDLQNELLAALPEAAIFRQCFSPGVTGALPFIWAGHRAEVRYTYRIEDLSSEDALWDGLAGNIRREIRKARRRVEVREDLDLDRFQSVWAKTFERQGLPDPDRARLERIEEACAPRGVRSMLGASDDEGRVHAVAYIVWDECSAYYLLGGGDPETRTSGAASLLLWEAVRRARAVTRSFDFEGSMLPPVERFFRAFGGRQTPYLDVSRTSRAAGAVLTARDWWRRAG